MAKRGGNQKNGVINSELLQRIDKMDDNKDYDPYASIKRTTISQEELFSSEDYELDEDDYVSKIENDKKESKLPIILTIAFISIMLAVGIFMFVNILK